MRIPNPKFLPGQAVYVVNKESLTVFQDKIDRIHFDRISPSDEDGFWVYLCDVEIEKGEFLCANFAEVMEVLNG